MKGKLEDMVTEIEDICKNKELLSPHYEGYTRPLKEKPNDIVPELENIVRMKMPCI